ncbi:MAG: DNA-primase RepB domain-containing protein, partial [bacterium]
FLKKAGLGSVGLAALGLSPASALNLRSDSLSFSDSDDEYLNIDTESNDIAKDKLNSLFLKSIDKNGVNLDYAKKRVESALVSDNVKSIMKKDFDKTANNFRIAFKRFGEVKNYVLKKGGYLNIEKIKDIVNESIFDVKEYKILICSEFENRMKKSVDIDKIDFNTPFSEKQKANINCALDNLGFKNDDVLFVWAVKGEDLLKSWKIRRSEIDNIRPELARANSNGANIYCNMNRLVPDPASAKKSEYNRLQHTIFLDIDTKNASASDIFRQAKAILGKPSMVVQSSHGNYHGYWITENECEFEKLSVIMRGLSNEIGLDHTHDIARQMRLPGFFNKKDDKNDLAFIIENRNIRLDDERLYEVYKKYLVFEEEKQQKILENRTIRNEKRNNQNFTKTEDFSLEEIFDYFSQKVGEKYKSQSEADFAFALYSFSKNYDEDNIKDFLKIKSERKHNAENYAQKLVEKAGGYSVKPS